MAYITYATYITYITYINHSYICCVGYKNKHNLNMKKVSFLKCVKN